MPLFFKQLVSLRMFTGLISALALVSCSTGSSESAKNISLNLDAESEISSITFIHNQGHRGLNGFAVAFGDEGSAIYNMDGDEIWKETIPAKLVTYDGHALLIYRTHEDKTILDRYSVSDVTYVGFLERQMPSEIAATTLQRTSFSSLGPLTISGDIVRMPSENFTKTVSYSSNRSVAAIASTSKPMPYFPDGVVAIASADGHIELLSEMDFKSSLK